MPNPHKLKPGQWTDGNFYLFFSYKRHVNGTLSLRFFPFDIFFSALLLIFLDFPTRKHSIQQTKSNDIANGGKKAISALLENVLTLEIKQRMQ